MSLPLSHINPSTLERERLVDISSVSLKSMYNGINSGVEWTQNSTILILDAISPEQELSGSQSSIGATSIGNSIGNRRRRSLESVHNLHFNPYLQRVIESEELTSLEENSVAWSDMSQIGSQSERDLFDFNDRLLTNLPSNRTIFSDCKYSEHEFCLQGRLRVNHLKADDLPVLITLNFTIDLKSVDKILTEKRDIFVIRTALEVMKTDDTEP